MANKITKIGITNDKISGRGGIALFLRYLENIGTYKLIISILPSFLSKRGKGLQFHQFLKQVFSFFMDGTDMSISGFDLKKKDEGYMALLENKAEEMASSHQIKRFFSKISGVTNILFSKVLNELFVWRLLLEKPVVIELGIDTMVLNNDDAQKREGCEPTYKKKRGFQPLHICWGPFLIDVLFRKGSAHSNHGNDYIDRVSSIVKLIRKRYSKDVPIIICADSGFADQKAYEHFEENLGIHYITTGKKHKAVTDYVKQIPIKDFGEYSKNKAIWAYTEFGSRLGSWSKFRRCIFTKLNCDENRQCILDFAKPDNVIYTNIGLCKEADQRLMKAGGEHYFETETIIEKCHHRGADELIHRSLKELATKEQLPFKSFGMNKAYYFLLVITHFIFEAYKQDVTQDVIPVTVYPNTFRRKMIDFAVKITLGARNVILNATKTIHETIKISELWVRCQSPPQIMIT